MLAEAPTPTLFAFGSLPPVLADCAPTALLAPASQPPMLADLRSTTFLARRALTTVLADLRSPTLLAPRAHTTVWTFWTNIFWFFGDCRAWRTKIKRIQPSLNHLNTYLLKISKRLKTSYIHARFSAASTTSTISASSVSLSTGNTSQFQCFLCSLICF